MAEDLPYKAEYAKSNRASCKSCKGSIAKDSLRMAKMVQSRHFDGKVPNWFHFGCFFNKRVPLGDVTDISGFTSLRWDDQEKIKSKVSGGVSKTVSTQGGNGAETSEVDAALDKSLGIEYAKSGRSSCYACGGKIEKGEVRICKYMEPSPDSSAFGNIPLMPHWHHIDCFVEKRAELEVDVLVTAEMITGFSTMDKKDKVILQEKLGTCKSKKTKKRKAPTGEKKAGGNKKVKEEGKTDEEKKEEEDLKEQNKRIWEIRDALKNQCTTSQLRQMLVENDQPNNGGESVLLDRCTEGLAFGALKTCPECNNGHLSYSNEGYVCHGNITEWTKCQYSTREPGRKKWVISSDLKEIEFLKTFKPKLCKRTFPTVKESVTKKVNGKDEVDAMPAAAPDPDKPLANLTFGVIGRLKKSKASIKSVIEELGGSVKEKVSPDLTCCLSSPGEVDKSSKKIKDCKKMDVPVVSEDYLETVKTEGALSAISKHSLVSWGNDKGTSNQLKRKHSSSDAVDGSKNVKKSGSGKQVEKKVKLSAKGGGVVDPESGLENVAHVYQVKNAKYNAVLGMVDITRGTNSYYKLQILKNDTKNKYYLFRSWGRVGTTIGGNKLQEFGSSEAGAICQFEELYLEKTGNYWCDRERFVKQANRFYPLDIDYGQDEAVTSIKVGSNSSLPLQVQELVRMIFDIESMKKAMVEYEIDLNKMPLGKLSKKQIQTAYSVLSEAQKLIEEKGSSGAVLDASNRFYTLIPHDFGMKKPPLLDSGELIKTKVEMLDNLLEIEVAYNLIKETTTDEDPLDTYYKKLKTCIEPMSKDDDEWTFIETYVKNTHASTHRNYKLELEEVFKIDREGEYKRYKPFKELHNRKLLWHGSRITNYAGILSQGLRIAPPEAPVTGYMFGKGIYFADMVSKSANYCSALRSNPVGLMLLCEVALGNMEELTRAKYVSKLPAGKHSVKGCGRTCPDPTSDHVLSDGTIVPYGEGIQSRTDDTSLLYNEYIVYDVAQVNMKYLLKLKFNYE